MIDESYEDVAALYPSITEEKYQEIKNSSEEYVIFEGFLIRASELPEHADAANVAEQLEDIRSGNIGSFQA